MAEKYGFQKASWTPAQGIEELINELDQKGAIIHWWWFWQTRLY